jgi:hypothetical protein
LGDAAAREQSTRVFALPEPQGSGARQDVLAVFPAEGARDPVAEGVVCAHRVGRQPVTGPPRIHQTLQREWAYALEYAASEACRASLPHWVRHYNERRTHSALGDRPLIQRVREVPGLDS